MHFKCISNQNRNRIHNNYRHCDGKDNYEHDEVESGGVSPRLVEHLPTLRLRTKQKSCSA